MKISEDFRHNRRIILGFEFTWGIGTGCLQVATVMAGYLNYLGASRTIIGFLPAVTTATLLAAATLSVHLIRPEKGRIRKVILVYGIGSLCYVFLGLLTLLLPVDSIKARIAACLLLQAAFGYFVFSGDPHYTSMLVEMTSPRERGRFFGLRIAAFGSGGVVGGLLASSLLRSIPSPYDYGSCFLTGALMILISIVWFSRFREMSLPEKAEVTRYGTLIASGLSLLRNHRDFRQFTYWQVLFLMMAGIYPFLGVWIHDRLDLPESAMGQLSIAFTLATVMFAPLLGFLGDHLGHRVAMRVSICVFMVGLATVATAGSYPAVWFGFLLCSCDLGTNAVVTPNYAYALLPNTQPAKVMGALMCVGATVRTVSYLSIGVLLDRLSYLPMVGAAVVLGLLCLTVSLRLADDRAEGRWRRG